MASSCMVPAPETGEEVTQRNSIWVYRRDEKGEMRQNELRFLKQCTLHAERVRGEPTHLTVK